MKHMPTPDLLAHLQSVVGTSLNRHFATATEWFPHEFVPYEEGRNFLDEPWKPSDSTLDDVAQTALEVNLLTEDNLPYYHLAIWETFGGEGPWAEWIRRWTAEEGRHAIVLRDYLVVTRAVDPVVLERERMATVETGFRAPEKDLLRTLAYVSFQELATRISHRNTGRLSGDAGLERLLSRIATDENLHMVFYRDLVAAALEVDPAAMLEAIAIELATFAMPGAAAPQFRRRAAAVARAGIYNLSVHRNDIVEPLLSYWGIFELTGLPPAAEAAREQIAAVVAELDRRVAKSVR